ncbi:glutathione transferase GstA [Oxalobacteraceae bacterium OM1]|nr:glutathione transferase GstA [Oxalobacteraceae bacterium OM1]
MKLFYTPGVCSLAPHILLREAGLEFTLDRIGDDKRTQDGRDYLTLNPSGYVPTLEIEPGVALTEGPAIMQYIADHAPAAQLAPEHGTLARYQLQSWLNFITSELHKSYSALFKPNMPAEARSTFKEQINTRLAHVEKTLAQQEHLLPSGFSAADAYLFVVVGWSGFVGIEIERYPAIVAHRKRVQARPAVQAAMRAEGLVK